MSDLAVEVPFPRVRIALLLDDTQVPAWTRLVIENLVLDESVEIVTAVINKEPRARPTWSLIRRRASEALYRVYEKTDRFVFRETPDALNTVTIADLLDEVPKLETVPIRKGFIHRFDRETIDSLVTARLDVIIRFGFNILRGDILKASTYGTWSYHHGDPRAYRGGPPFFWEMHEGSPTSGVMLQVLSEELDGGYIIYQSTSRTDFLSLSRGKNAAYWKGAQFVGRCIRDLQADPSRFMDSRSRLQIRERYERGIYRTPNSRVMMHFLYKRVRYLTNRAWSRIRWRDQWCIGVNQNQSALPDATKMTFKVLVPPRDRVFADPFPLVKDNKTYVFFEELVGSQEGSISLGEVGPYGSLKLMGNVLTRTHHMSYPCLFSEVDEVYLVPESFDAKEVVIYRMLRFPNQWERHATVCQDIQAVDPTLIHYENRYWLFCNVASPGMSPNDELHIFHAKQIRGPWEPHRSNPVVSDVRFARPAGSFFSHNGSLIRPAQDCATRYGNAVRFLRVEELSLFAYREEEVGILQPVRDSTFTGTHTHNRAGGTTFVDLRIAQPRLRVMGRQRVPSTAELDFLGSTSRP